MKISSLQDFADWLTDLDPSSSICWPCMLPNFEIYLHENNDQNIVRALKTIQGLALGTENPEQTFYRLLEQFIFIDLRIDKERFAGGFPLSLENGRNLKFSWKAFTHWIIGQLELITHAETSLSPCLREAVNNHKKTWQGE